MCFLVPSSYRSLSATLPLAGFSALCRGLRGIESKQRNHRKQEPLKTGGDIRCTQFYRSADWGASQPPLEFTTHVHHSRGISDLGFSAFPASRGHREPRFYNRREITMSLKLLILIPKKVVRFEQLWARKLSDLNNFLI